MNEIISRHERIALQFSGGKDSLACLYLMRPYWDRITIYWCNMGDAFPETVAQMARIREEVPHFVQIDGQQPEVIKQFGIPSDIVPTSATPMGVSAASKGFLIQDRYSCCVRSKMLPMHERMIADGITLIIRGQKKSDAEKGPLCSGQVDGGIEYLFPVEDWTDANVLAFLREQNVEIPRFYEMLNDAPDCMTCSAWWDKGESKYLKRYHIEKYEIVQERLDTIREAIAPHITDFNDEVAL